jgi:LPS export ABC transporter protein LptC
MKKAVKVITILALLILLNCKVNYSGKDSNERKFPTIIQSNYIHNIYKNKKKYLVASIEKAEFYEKSKTIECTFINVEIYDSKEVLKSRIKADEALIDNKEKKLTFNNNVEMEISEKEATLYADQIILDSEKNRLNCPGKLVMKKKDGSYIRADSLESDVSLEITNFKNMEIRYFYDEEKKK